MFKQTIFTSIIFMAIATSPAFSMECGLPVKSVFSDKDGPVSIHASKKDRHPSFFYTSKMGVNTDGAARSYHPEDPTAKKLAFNNIANAITRGWNAQGRLLDCDYDQVKHRHDARLRRGACFTQYIRAFEGARDNKYNPNKFPRVEFGQILAKKRNVALGYSIPCVIKSGPNAGFFVSQTSLALDNSADVCDPKRWVDSLTVNAVVYPGGVAIRAQGIRTDKGDLVVVRDRESERLAFALHGDSGPKNDIGEGSVALASALSKTTIPNNATYDQVKELARNKVDFLVFPKDDVIRHYGAGEKVTQTEIDKFGERIFKEWGGLKRLSACIEEHG